MPKEQKDLTGVLFKNKDKKSDKHPNFTGRAMVEGVEYWLSAWVNEHENGKYISLRFTAQDEDSKSDAGSTEEDGGIGF